jgi:hypothetical protein
MKRRLFVILEELTKLPSWKSGQLRSGNWWQKQTENRERDQKRVS